MEKLRLIGIDAPESSPNPRAFRAAARHHQDVDEIVKLGKRSAKYLRTILHEGDAVQLQFDVERRDRYGRLLAYVFLPSGEFVNELLVREGYAEPYTVKPNVRYLKRLARVH